MGPRAEHPMILFRGCGVTLKPPRYGNYHNPPSHLPPPPPSPRWKTKVPTTRLMSGDLRVDTGVLYNEIGWLGGLGCSVRCGGAMCPSRQSVFCLGGFKFYAIYHKHAFIRTSKNNIIAIHDPSIHPSIHPCIISISVKLFS